MRKLEERYEEKYRKRYSGHARRCLNLLAASISRKEERPPSKGKDEREILKRLLKILRTFGEAITGEWLSKCPLLIFLFPF